MSQSPKIPPTVMQILAEEERRESRFTRWALAAAVVLHVAIFAIHWPSFASAARDGEQDKPRVFVVKIVRFTPPPPQQQQMPIKKPPQKIPIPDPTPDDPEPVRVEEPRLQIDDLEVPTYVPGMPEIPPEPVTEPRVYRVGGDVKEPVKDFAPNPVYPELARQVHREGTVILECVIERDGSVASISVLRPEPFGLTEAAVEAVQRWRFKPATLNGEPVTVIYNLAVRFRLQ